MKFDKIGIFKGRPISEMTREDLLDFASWAGKELTRYGIMEKETQDYRIKKELSK